MDASQGGGRRPSQRSGRELCSILQPDIAGLQSCGAGARDKHGCLEVGVVLVHHAYDLAVDLFSYVGSPFEGVVPGPHDNINLRGKCQSIGLADPGGLAHPRAVLPHGNVRGQLHGAEHLQPPLRQPDAALVVLPAALSQVHIAVRTPLAIPVQWVQASVSSNADNDALLLQHISEGLPAAGRLLQRLLPQHQATAEAAEALSRAKELAPGAAALRAAVSPSLHQQALQLLVRLGGVQHAAPALRKALHGGLHLHKEGIDWLNGIGLQDAP
mmetsp:Transcript_22484/g.71284  ORF Transcript_22484/g.71284 Transcript_22484/m.71284 type:complete len:271 (-) Transcript_22484:316-1128(-)